MSAEQHDDIRYVTSHSPDVFLQRLRSHSSSRLLDSGLWADGIVVTQRRNRATARLRMRDKQPRFFALVAYLAFVIRTGNTEVNVSFGVPPFTRAFAIVAVLNSLLMIFFIRASKNPSTLVEITLWVMAIGWSVLPFWAPRQYPVERGHLLYVIEQCAQADK